MEVKELNLEFKWTPSCFKLQYAQAFSVVLVSDFCAGVVGRPTGRQTRGDKGEKVLTRLNPDPV